MGANTAIEWATHTFNSWTGCQKVSPACDHCYAEATAKRAPATFGGWGPHAERKRTGESYWRQPLLWNKRAAKEGARPRVFCASMADVFDNAVPIDWLVDVLELMRTTQHLDWLLLTKRPQLIRVRIELASIAAEARNMAGLVAWLGAWLRGAPPANVWLGTTVENQPEADRRIPHLLAVPAAKRFLSCEPLLGPVDLAEWIECIDHCGNCGGESPGQKDDICPLCGAENHLISTWGFAEAERYRTGERWDQESAAGRRDVDGTNPTIDWIIAGGESGPRARASHPDWFRSLRDQCQAAGVPFFFKQHGEWIGVPDLRQLPGGSGPGFGAFDHAPYDQEHEAVRVGKKAAGAMLDGREWREVPA